MTSCVYGSCMCPTLRGRRSTIHFKQSRLMGPTPTHATVLRTGVRRSGERPRRGHTFLKKFSPSSYMAAHSFSMLCLHTSPAEWTLPCHASSTLCATWTQGLGPSGFNTMVGQGRSQYTYTGCSFPKQRLFCIGDHLGGTENVNYGVQILMSLLVQSGMLENVYCNRLPPG